MKSARIEGQGPYLSAAKAFRMATRCSSPEQRLWAAVIEQAIADLADDKEKRAARRFIESSDLDGIADAIGMHVDGVRRFVAVADDAAADWKVRVRLAA